jgi:uncharacterized protein YndB with AHSA1/START domain
MSELQVSVERVIAAPPAAIFAVVADAARHREIDGSGSVQGVKGESEPLRAGAVFGMSMKKGVPYTTKNTVVEFEPDRLIGWRTEGLGGLVGGRVWRYELEPTDEGTRVRETWDIRRDKQRFFLRRGSFPTSTEKAMTATLQRLAAVVEA